MTERRILRKWRNEIKQRTRNAQKSRDAKILQILATRTEEWQVDMPEWLAIPAINHDLGNMLKADAAIAIALATWQHLRVIAELAAAGIDEPLGNQTRSTKELYVDMEWLRRFDETGVLSARYIDWSQIASAKTSRDPILGKARIETTKNRYGSDENWGPDGWARPDPLKGSINQAGRMAQVFKAVRKEIDCDHLDATDLTEFDEETRSTRGYWECHVPRECDTQLNDPRSSWSGGFGGNILLSGVAELLGAILGVDEWHQS